MCRFKFVASVDDVWTCIFRLSWHLNSNFFSVGICTEIFIWTDFSIVWSAVIPTLTASLQCYLNAKLVFSPELCFWKLPSQVPKEVKSGLMCRYCGWLMLVLQPQLHLFGCVCAPGVIRRALSTVARVNDAHFHVQKLQTEAFSSPFNKSMNTDHSHVCVLNIK